MKRKKSLILYNAFLFIIVFCFFVCDARLSCVEYTIESPKVEHELRFAVITDLHSCFYGSHQQGLTENIDGYEPDAVFIAGDYFDDVMKDDGALCLIKKLSESYDVYYVSGNHEWWSGRMNEMFDTLKEHGVTVLRGDTCYLETRGQKFSVSGVDDPQTDIYDSDYLSWDEQFENVCDTADKDGFSILLSHRPEKIHDYSTSNFDLVICGHAHGGQVRIPYLLNGLYAPDQGLFPQYAGGEYDLSDTKLIVSRGLARESTMLPRIFNRPELVFITVK